MGLYFLHLRDHRGQTIDPEGQHFADVRAVITAVHAGARDVIATDIKSDGMLDLRYRIDAENVAGETVYSLRFADGVDIIQAEPR